MSVRDWRHRSAHQVGLAGVLWLLMCAASAQARVGGGQTFGGGGGGGSSFGGGAGGGGGEAELIFFLIELCIREPRLGVPIVAALLVWVGIQHWQSRNNAQRTIEARKRVRGRPRHSTRSKALDLLTREDPGFSLAPLKDFLVLVHRRATEAATTDHWSALTPFVSPSARAALTGQLRNATEVREVVAGAVTLTHARLRGDTVQIEVEYATSRIEVLQSRPHRFRLVERWIFQRNRGVSSLPPDQMRRLGCPSCGVSIETTRMGACPNCDTAISSGQLQWELVSVQQVRRVTHDPPELDRLPSGREPGYDLPTVQSVHLPVQMRSLMGRHPDFDPEAFGQRVAGIFFALQQHWSAGEWSKARPWVTDSLYQSLRFWVEQYTTHGLRNRVENVELHKVAIVEIDTDAWYETVVVRLHAAAHDYVTDATGTVVAGDADAARWFSEYWTFIRAVGTGGAIHDAHQCPSCAAPLDQIGQTGVCGYCDSKISSGNFDWVLSGITQAESYNGIG